MPGVAEALLQEKLVGLRQLADANGSNCPPLETEIRVQPTQAS
jgi:hypothetical protein